MLQRQLNAWNWSATTEVFCNGFKDRLTTFDTEQYWDGTKASHERLWSALIERLEGFSDSLNLEYRVHRPTAIRGKSWAAKTPEVVEIDQIQF